MAYHCMCVFKYAKLSYCLKTPYLGNEGNPLLNWACLEKVIPEMKMLVLGLSVNVNTVKAILPEINYPVPSREADLLSRIEKMFNSSHPGFKGGAKGIIELHSTNSRSKDKSWLPKLTNYYNDATPGGLLVCKYNVYRGPRVVNSLTRWKRSGPVTTLSRNYSTSTGRTTNVLKKLDNLSKRSLNYPNRVIDRKLYKNFILNPTMFLAAYDKIKSRPGSMTPGITPTTLDGISIEEINKIIDSLKNEKFQFTPGRRIHIPKKSGKLRPLTIGNPRDKLVQEIIRMVLEAIYEPLFLPCSHGFRKGYSCHTALRSIFTGFNGCTWWIEGDFESCFDSIDHEKLMNLLSSKIEDQRFLQLIRKALNAGYFDFAIRKTDLVGVPQGNIISPILANIFLHELDKFIHNLKEEFDSKEPKTGRSREYYQAQYQLKKAKKALHDDKIEESEKPDSKLIKSLIKKLQKTQSKRLDKNTHRLMYIRYADDWIVAVNGSYKITREILKKIEDFCFSIGLRLSKDKTKITNSYLDYINFLGVRIKHNGVVTWSKHKNGFKQRNRRAILLSAPIQKIKLKLSNTGFVKNNRGVSRTSWTPLTLRQIIYNYNSILRGYDNYYSFIHNRGATMSWLYYVMRDSAARTIAHKLSLKRRSKVYKKYGMSLTITDYENRNIDKSPKNVIQLFKPTYIMNCWDFKINKNNYNISQFYSETISLANLDNLKCSVCLSDYRIEMHHIRAMKDLSPKTKGLDRLMARAKRKQIPLCRSCHMKYHRGENLTIINDENNDNDNQ